MRPVRFVALSEDGQALVLADELGRLLGLPLDDRLHHVLAGDEEPPPVAPTAPASAPAAPAPAERRPPVNLSPRDIQTRIRSGESADDIARGAGVAVDRVLRYAGPVLQERAMLAQAARRARLSTSDSGERMAEVVDVKLAQHGVDAASVSWDAWRREDGTWRVTAAWSSGKSTAEASWDLERTRQRVSPHDEMAQFLSTPAPTKLTPEPTETPSRSSGREAARPSRDPLHGMAPATNDADPSVRGIRERSDRDGADREADPLRRDALRAVLERPLNEPARSERHAGMLGLPGSEPVEPRDAPAVPSLAVLRPRRNDVGGAEEETAETEERREPAVAGASKPRNRLPAWEDVLFGGDATPRSSSSS